MEPRIQYCTTSDGVSIAYAVFGEGPLLVWGSVVWGDVHMYSAGVATTGFLVSSLDAFVEGGWRVVLHDGRGSGSSQRETADLSLDGRLRDLEAVAEAAGADRFVLSAGMRLGRPQSAMRLRTQSECLVWSS
jgi:pimeloyl-ACP methyl ester carboxylesterase